MMITQLVNKKIVKHAKLIMIPAFVLGSSFLWAEITDNQTPQETIEFYYRQLSQNFNNGSSSDQNEIDEKVLTIVDKLFDLERLASQVIQKEWPGLNKHEQEMFVNALQKSVQQKILSEIRINSSNSLPSLKFESIKNSNNVSTLNYLVSIGNGKKDLTLYMLKYPDGNWRITNLKSGKNSLRRVYYGFCQKIIKKYSLPYLIAKLTDSDYIVLEDFESGEPGQLPPNWLWKKSDNNKNKPYEIGIENSNKYLAAEDNGESVILAKDIDWDLDEYPYISFRWRVHQLPEGGDERFGKSVDSAAGIYVIYKKKLGLIPESVKFVWSTTLPVGTATQRSGVGRPWNIVVESGEERVGEWQTFVFNLKEAYKKTFGGNPPSKPEGIAILSDANSTKSKAYADYDDIRALKNADANSGVKKILKGE